MIHTLPISNRKLIPPNNMITETGDIVDAQNKQDKK